MTQKVPQSMLQEDYATSSELTGVADGRYTKAESDGLYLQLSDFDPSSGTSVWTGPNTIVTPGGA